MYISFTEILVILIVAIIVIKPERMPEVARSLGRFVKWMRETSSKLKDEFIHDRKQ